MRMKNFCALGLMVLISVTAQAEGLKYFKASAATTWGDAESLCSKATDSNLKWRLPQDSEFLAVALSLSESDRAFITFSTPGESRSSVILMWVQGDDAEANAQFKAKKSIVASLADGGGTELKPFDLVNDVKEIVDYTNTLRHSSTAKDPAHVEIIKASDALVNSLKKGITVFCVQAG